MDQMEFNELLEKVVLSVIDVLRSEIVSWSLRGVLDDVNKRMSVNFGRVISHIFADFYIITIPVSKGMEEMTKRNSPQFHFGISGDDEMLGKLLGISEDEMNNLLDMARQERGGSKVEGQSDTGAEGVIYQQPEIGFRMGEKRSAQDADQRSVGQIMGSIRDIARRLNFNQRRRIFEIFIERNLFNLGSFSTIPKDRLAGNTSWFQWVQDLFNKIISLGKSQDKNREIFLALESLFLNFLSR
jgi:hypothetical protein